MSAQQPDLIVYGVPLSQPVRAVMWLLLNRDMPFELVLTNPGSQGSRGSRSEAYLRMNPGGTIPTLKERASGFVLAEAHAILVYLCRQHGWTDFYPEDPRRSARIDWYLHYHHRNVREASVALVAPMFRKDLGISEDVQAASRRTLERALLTLESGWLSDSAYLAGAAPTLADIAAYVELGQLKPGFSNLHDFSDFPRLRSWMEAMSELPGHDTAHVVLMELGDLSTSPPDIERIKSANKRALGALPS